MIVLKEYDIGGGTELQRSGFAEYFTKLIDSSHLLVTSIVFFVWSFIHCARAKLRQSSSHIESVWLHLQASFSGAINATLVLGLRRVLDGFYNTIDASMNYFVFPVAAGIYYALFRLVNSYCLLCTLVCLYVRMWVADRVDKGSIYISEWSASGPWALFNMSWREAARDVLLEVDELLF